MDVVRWLQWWRGKFYVESWRDCRLGVKFCKSQPEKSTSKKGEDNDAVHGGFLFEKAGAFVSGGAGREDIID